MNPAGASIADPPADVPVKKPKGTKKPAKDQTPEERKIESEKRASRRAAKKNREEAARLELERRQAELIYRQAMVAASKEDLVHGAAERAVLILKHEAIVSTYGCGQAGSETLSTSSVTSTPGGPPQLEPRTPGPHTPSPANQGRGLVGLSRLGDPRQTSSGSGEKSIDLNRDFEATPLASKRARRISGEDLPPAVNPFDGMTADDGEAALHDMIFEGGHAGLDGFSEDQGPAYDIHGEPLFGQDTQAPKTEDAMTQDAITQATAAAIAATMGEGFVLPKKSRRTANFSTQEDTLLCQGWVEVSQDPICGAEQKGFQFWRKVWNFFHEHRKFEPNPFFSDRSEVSLAKRWGVIHAECSKFQGSFELVGRRQVSGHTQLDTVLRALEHFKANNDNKAFTLSHCWNVLRDTKKWETSYDAWRLADEAKQKGKATAAGVVDLEEADPQAPAGPSSSGRVRRPAGQKSTKAEMARLAAQTSFQDTIRELMGKKESALAEREDRRRKEKEVAEKHFHELQSKALEVDESMAKARLMEMEAKAKIAEAEAAKMLLEAEAKAKAIEADAKTKLVEAEAFLMAEENKIMLTDLDTIAEPDRKAWFARRQKEIRDRIA